MLNRFLKYVKIDTQSDPLSETSPSTSKQLTLSKILEKECNDLGLKNVEYCQNGIVMATIPSTVSNPAPTIFWNSHMDTSPEYSGTDVNPIVHNDYDGKDIQLQNSKTIRVVDNPSLLNLVGTTIITSDGSTLLGADDKTGIAVIMTAAEY